MMDYAFIVVSVVGGIFGIISLMILDRNWFRRERFKLERDSIRAENNIRMKKMAKELGLDKKTPLQNPSNSNEFLPAPAPSQFDIKSLLPLLSKLAPEQLEGLIDQFLPETEEGALPAGIDSLIDFAAKNPALVQGFLDKMNKGGAAGAQQGQSGYQV